MNDQPIEEVKPTLNSYLFEFGSDSDPCGLCIRVKGVTREDALVSLRKALEQLCEDHGYDVYSDKEYTGVDVGRALEYISLYIYPDNITVDHVTDEEDAEDECERCGKPASSIRGEGDEEELLCTACQEEWDIQNYEADNLP